MERHETNRVGVDVGHVHQHAVVARRVHRRRNHRAGRQFRRRLRRQVRPVAVAVAVAVAGARVVERVGGVDVGEDGANERRVARPRVARRAASRPSRGSRRERERHPGRFDGGVDGDDPRQHRLPELERLLRVHPARDGSIGELRGRRQPRETSEEPNEHPRVCRRGRDVPGVHAPDDHAGHVRGEFPRARRVHERRLATQHGSARFRLERDEGSDDVALSKRGGERRARRRVVGHLRGGDHAGNAAGKRHANVPGGFVHAFHHRGLDDRPGRGRAHVAPEKFAFFADGAFVSARKSGGVAREAQFHLALAGVRANHRRANHLSRRERLRGGLIRGEAEVLEPRESADVPPELHEHPVGFHAGDDAVRRRAGDGVGERRHHRQLGLDERLFVRDGGAASLGVHGEHAELELGALAHFGGGDAAGDVAHVVGRAQRLHPGRELHDGAVRFHRDNLAANVHAGRELVEG